MIAYDNMRLEKPEPPTCYAEVRCAAIAPCPAYGPYGDLKRYLRLKLQMHRQADYMEGFPERCGMLLCTLVFSVEWGCVDIVRLAWARIDQLRGGHNRSPGIPFLPL